MTLGAVIFFKTLIHLNVKIEIKRSIPINKSCKGRKTGLTGAATGCAMVSLF